MSRAARRLGLVGVIGWLAVAPPAWGATTGSVTMVSGSGDYIGAGNTFLFHQPGLGLSGNLGQVRVTTPTPPGAAFGYTLTFQAPSGQLLQDGEYPLAQRAAGPGGYAGLDIFGDGRGCNRSFDRFTIKDIHVDGMGNVDRFWAVYEQHCEQYGASALFGEVRIGEPASSSNEVVEPAAISWPTTAVGATSGEVPVTVKATGPATITRVGLSGPDASQFRLIGDGCTGVALASGDECQVSVAVRPASAGDLSGELDVTDGTGTVTAVPLSLLVQPHVHSISPAAGLPAGGNSVTITGDNLNAAQSVHFGDIAASFSVVSPTEIVAHPPPGTRGQTASVAVFGAHGTAGGGIAYTWADPPAPPSAPSATAGYDSATVQFSPPSDDGGAAVSGYTVTASPGGEQATGTYSPITVSGLSPGTRYTFAVTATSAAGTSTTVNAGPVTTLKTTSTTVSVHPSSVPYGTPMTLTADVGSPFSGTPTGSVEFSTTRATITSTIGADGMATTDPQVLDVGWKVAARYGGDASFWNSQGFVVPAIRPANTALTLTDSPRSSPPDANVTLTAAVANLDTSAAPTGTVQFTINGYDVFGPQALGPLGIASITLQALPAGSYQLGALYHDNVHSPTDFTDSQATLVHTSGSPPITGPLTGTGPPVQAGPPPQRPSVCDVRLSVGHPAVSRTDVITIATRPSCAGLLSYHAALSGKDYRSGAIGSRANARHVLRLTPTAGVVRRLSHASRLTAQVTLEFVPLPKGKPVTHRLSVVLPGHRH